MNRACCEARRRTTHAPIRHNGVDDVNDDIIQLIETFDFDAGPVAVERRNRGFTLIHAGQDHRRGAVKSRNAIKGGSFICVRRAVQRHGSNSSIRFAG